MKLILTSEELLTVLRNGVDIELNGPGAYYPSKFEREYGSSDSYCITFEPYTTEQQADRLYDALHELDSIPDDDDKPTVENL